MTVSEELFHPSEGRRDPVGRSDEEQCNSITIHAMRNTVAKMRETMMLSSKRETREIHSRNTVARDEKQMWICELQFERNAKE